jgi:exopolyphosphatase/guanosine-5'-triphosphate,3'-diphosphate pyrophosphatase
MFAAVDLGSNSFRLHIGHQVDNRMRIVKSAREQVRLAAGLDSHNVLSGDAIDDAVRALRGFRDILAQYRLLAVRVVATNTYRIAKNADELLRRTQEAIGYPIDIISGEEEGRLIYMGVAHEVGRPQEPRLVIDIGGGSTELIVGRGSEIGAVESFSIGTHLHSTAFFKDGQIDARSFANAILAARARFDGASELFAPARWQAVYGSSGTMRAINEVIAVNGLGDGGMSLAGLKTLEQVLVRCGHVDRFVLPGVKKERVPAMLGGLAILLGAMQELRVGRVTAIDAGLRLGALCDMELRANRHDRRDESIAAFLRRLGVDEQRAGRTAALALYVHAQLGADPQYQRYLDWASRLHDVGHVISHSGAHKHGAYIVEHADLPGFSTTEQAVMAQLVLGQKGNLKKVKEALDNAEYARAQLALRLAVLMVHARIDDPAPKLTVRMKTRIEITVSAQLNERYPMFAQALVKEKDSWDDVNVPVVIAVA